MSTNAFDYGTDTSRKAPTHESMQKVCELVDQAVVAEKEMIEAEELAKTKRENHRRIMEELIPSAMDDLGMEEFRTTSGFRVKVKSDVTHSLSADRREAGMTWLEDNGHGAVIKRELGISFAKGQEDLAQAVVTELSSLHPGLPVSSSRNVHPSTLKSLLKTLLERGVVVPVDIFKVQRVRKAVIDT